MAQQATKLFNNCEIPDAAIIQCPDIGFELRKVKRCLTCKHYKGFAKATMNGEDLPFSVDNVNVICGRPTTRKMILVSED